MLYDFSIKFSINQSMNLVFFNYSTKSYSLLAKTEEDEEFVPKEVEFWVVDSFLEGWEVEWESEVEYFLLLLEL